MLALEGFGFRKKRRFKFSGKAKILDLGLDFEEGRKRGITFGFGLYFEEGGESLIWRRLSLLE